jgi:NADH:ubiquinone oxidoreductase subunit
MNNGLQKISLLIFLIITFFNGYKVGDDMFGNIYMRNKNDSKRWVLYEGDVDSSKVPPEWNGWLRYTSNKIPSLQKKYSWEKKHVKNQTGTKKLVLPKCLSFKQSKR